MGEANTWSCLKWRSIEREAEAQARRDAIQRQEMMITVVGIVVLSRFRLGAVAYLHFMGG